jgi:hypothetical protein
MSEEEKKVLNGKKPTDVILKNSKQMEELIAAQLDMINHHGTTIGTLRETIWQDMFKQIIPKKFILVHSVFIIDSNNQISNEVDLAIMDEMYTPYVFQYGKMKFVPIEAVAVVVECKSSKCSGDVKKQLINWSEAIKKLKTCPKSIARIAFGISLEAPFTQPATRPIQILCCLNNSCKEDLQEHFDCIISLVKQELDVSFTENKKEAREFNLFEWFRKLNFHGEEKAYPYPEKKIQIRKDKSHEKEETTDKRELEKRKLSDYAIEGYPLLSLNFQLNQLLMLINNPMPFPHLAYAKMFQDAVTQQKENSKKKEGKQ